MHFQIFWDLKYLILTNISFKSIHFVLQPVWIPFGCISILHFSDFSDFSSFGYKFRGVPKLWMENFTFLVQTRPPVCACILLVFLLACGCSVFFNAGRS